MALKEQARQSGLFLSDEATEWNETDWPPLDGGGRCDHAAVVLDHHHETTDHNNNTDEKHIGQTVVVLGGYQQDVVRVTNSVLVLPLAEPDKQWREGPPMNKSRQGHASVVCNGSVYVLGGHEQGDSTFDCIERIPVHDLLQFSFTESSSNKEIHWETLNCRLTRGRSGCCAVAVHNRYIVVVAGCHASVDILDTRQDTVMAGPSMTHARAWCAGAVLGGHRIFVVGGCAKRTVEFWDFSPQWPKKEDTAATTTVSSSSSSGWTTHSELALSVQRFKCTVVVVGSCLVVAGGRNPTVQVLDPNRNRMWNLPEWNNHNNNEGRWGGTLVAVAHQIAVMGGRDHPNTCATLPLMDKNTWCFRRLCEMQWNGWYHVREGMGTRDADIAPRSTST